MEENVIMLLMYIPLVLFPLRRSYGRIYWSAELDVHTGSGSLGGFQCRGQ